MPKTVEELEKMFSETQNQVSLMKKDFELKLESAEKAVNEYKEIAAKREDELRKFREESEKTERERKIALAQAREREVASYADQLVKEGKIVFAQKGKLISFLNFLDSEKEVAVFTDEKDGSKRSHTQLSLFKEFFATIKAVHPTNRQEFSKGEKPMVVLPTDGKNADENATAFTEDMLPSNIRNFKEEEGQHFVEVKDKGEKVKVYPALGVDFAAKIYEYQQKYRESHGGKEISYGDAMIVVSRQTGLDARIPS